jgi:hypothetical protein
MPISSSYIEPVEWRSGNSSCLFRCQALTTGSILLNAQIFNAMRDPSNPRTTNK